MPSADSFRLAASRFDELADECRSLEGQVSDADAAGGLAGRSRVQDRVTAALEIALGTTDGIAEVCSEFAVIARQRADACDAYEAALRSYRAAHHTWSERQVEWRFAALDPERPSISWPGAEPVPPDPPEYYSTSSQWAGPR